MPFIPVPNCQQVELLYQYAGQSCETVLHYRTVGTPGPTDQATAASALVTWYNTNLKPLHHMTISLTTIRITDLSSDSAPVLDYSTGLPLVGVGGADGLPNSIALVITKRTALRGRSYRGRIYHMGIGEANCVGNQILGAHVTALLAAYNAALSFSISGSTWKMGVLSRQHGGIALLTGVITDVVTLSSDGFVDSQRRRLPGRGS